MNEEISKCIEVLKKGGVILYPTDTVWGLGCDATNDKAIDRIFRIKNLHESKALLCLVSDFKMLNQFVQEVPEVAYDILKYAAKPTTIIYEKPIRVAENLVAADDTLAIRVASDKFCRQLIRKFRKPIVSTSANISGEPTPANFGEISEEIRNASDYVVNWNRNSKKSKPSSIIKLGNDGTVKIIRS